MLVARKENVLKNIKTGTVDMFAKRNACCELLVGLRASILKCRKACCNLWRAVGSLSGFAVGRLAERNACCN